MTALSIIILNWNNWKDTIKCLDSLYKNSYSDFEPIIVDNASSDNSVDILSKKFPNIHIIKNTKNLGFAEANNIGIKYALQNFNPTYIMTLNNDTTIAKNSIDTLIAIMEKDSSLGAIQPKILRMNNPKIIDSAGLEIYAYGRSRDSGFSKKDTAEFSSGKEIFGSCAAASLYRADALKKVDFFDKKFFILFEDVDLSWKLRLAGYKILYEPDAIVYHNRGISSKKIISKYISTLKSYYSNRNCLLIIIKYYPLKYIFKFLLMHLIRAGKVTYHRSKLKDNLFNVLKESLKERARYRKFHLLRSLQNKWIIDKSFLETIIDIKKNLLHE